MPELMIGEQEEHTILMGATTYRLMSGMAEEEPEAIAALGAVPKVVFSSTLTAPLAWSRSELVAGDAVEAVRGLKEHNPLPLRTLGSVLDHPPLA